MLDIQLQEGQPTKYTVTLPNGDEFLLDRITSDTYRFEDGEGTTFLLDYNYESCDWELRPVAAVLTRRKTLKELAAVLAVLEGNA